MTTAAELPRRSDVVIVGGGIAAISAAWFLHKAGVDRGNTRLLDGNSPEAEHFAVIFANVASGVNIGRAGLHPFIDDDPAINVEVIGFGELGIRPNAHRHQEHITRQPLPILQLNRLNPLLPVKARRLRVRHNRQPQPLQILLQEKRAALI